MPEITQLSTNQQLFLEKIETGKTVFLTGKAGTGKSFVVKTAIDLLKSQKKNVIALAPTGVAANNIAGYELQSGKEYFFKAVVEGNVKAGDFNLESEIKVKDGCKIMYLANSKNNNLINGTMGIFRVKDGRFFIDIVGVLYALEEVKFSKKEYVLNEEETGLELRETGSIMQYPFKLAYALTIHKAQGLTFDEVTLDLSLPCFQRGQLYVGLSRVKTPEGLTIIVNR